MIKIVWIKDKYINYLRKFDEHVCFNKGQKRPYVGILFEVNNQKYYAPLSSPKPKFKEMKNYVDFIKLDGGNLGAINLNNMIPVVESSIVYIDINKLDDKKYSILLNKQLAFMKSKELEITYKAAKLYKSYKNKTLRPDVYARCCNYILLQSKSKSYNPDFKYVPK